VRLPLFVLCAALLSGPLLAEARLTLDPSKRLSQYIFDAWTSEDGLPSNSLLYLRQTHDGYLWISSFNGLSRFDGVAFTLFSKSTSDAFANNVVENLVEDRDGVLWAGVQGQGLVAYRDGAFRFDPATQAFAPFIKSLFVDETNLIWVGTQSDGVFTFDRRGFRPFEAGAPLRKVNILAIRKTRDGTLWVATQGHGLFSFRDGSFRTFTTADGLPSNLVNELFVDSEGTVWASTNKGLAAVRGGRVTPVPATLSYDAFGMVEDDAGRLWLAANGALFRIDRVTGRVESYTPKDGSPINFAYALCLDREGSLWVTCYNGGLFRIRDGKVTTFGRGEGLRGRIINAVCEAGPGVTLVGSDEGTVDVLDHGNVRPLVTRTSLAKTRIRDITRDSRGNTWIGTYSGLLRIGPDGRESWHSTATGFPDDRFRVAMEDRDGRLWFGTRNKGVIILERDGTWSLLDTARGLSSDFIMSFEQRPDGDVLVGTSGGGLNIVSTAGGIAVRSVIASLPGAIVYRTRTDAKGVTWIAFNGGLARLSGDRLSILDERAGFTGSPFDIQEDDSGNFWCPTAHGVVRVSRRELEAVADGRKGHVSTLLLGKNDGMKEPECTGTAKALRAADGSFVFPTLDGIVIVHPDRLPMNTVEPPVYVTGFSADGEGAPVTGAALTIAPGRKRFVFDYTALSLAHPPRVRFKVRLDGFDADWVDAGTRRSAVYTNLAPGPYSFRAIACNNDGLWNEKGASLWLTLRPFFYQTVWFKGLAVFLVAASVAAAVRARGEVLRARQRELERIVDERTRELRRQKELVEASRRFIRETFGRYLSDEVVTGLLEAPGGLRMGGEKRTLTVLISDLRGFSALADGMDPVDVVSLLNGYLEAMTAVILKWGGTIDEFLGDAILVLFGAPVLHVDDAVRAAACALEMQQEMAAVNARNHEKLGPEIEMGIGIHTGEAVVGNIGSQKRAKYGVVGRTVNFASRIESYTVGGQILVSTSTRDALGPLAELGASLSVQPKGMSPTTIHELTGLGGDLQIRLERRKEPRFQLQDGIPCRFVVVEGKDARGSERDGTIVALSADATEAEIRSAESVRPFTNLRLNLAASPGSEAYAKVLANGAVTGTFALRFTSLPEEVRRHLAVPLVQEPR